jgi:hypothetical protein
MIHLKLFENFNFLKKLKIEINEILLDIQDDFNELKWEMEEDNLLSWKFKSSSIKGIQKSRQMMKLVSEYFPEIKGRLSDIGIKSEISLRRIDMNGFWCDYFKIVICLRKDI